MELKLPGKRRGIWSIYAEQTSALFFSSFTLMPTLTARENIELSLLFSRKNRNKKKIDEVLQMVGLADRSDHLPSQLSGGEMQRVAIGRALDQRSSHHPG